MAPILYWTDADVWEYIRSNNLKYPSLYDAPFNAKQLGCVGCPLSNNRNKEFAYWPKYEAMWKKGGRAWWEKYSVKLKADGSSYVARKFPTFEANWSWWMEEKASMTRTCQIANSNGLAEQQRLLAAASVWLGIILVLDRYQ